MQTALSTGIADAHIYFHAAMIEAAAGNGAQSRQLLHEAAQTNPEYTRFHAHR
jgi:hypothetical protein